jgi:hypothetical protein
MPGAGAGFRDEGAGTGTAESHRREGVPGAGAGFRDEGAGTGTAESHRREGMPCRADHGGGEDADRHAVTCRSMGVPSEPLVMHRGYLNETTQATTKAGRGGPPRAARARRGTVAELG